MNFEDKNEDYIFEEDTSKSYINSLNDIQLIKHPVTGFPKALNRNNKTKNKSKIDFEISKESKDINDELETLNNSLSFNLTNDDILKLRWTNPIGEDEEDLNNSDSLDKKLHNLRFDFSGNICENINIQEKSEKDELYFYRGLHHHSQQSEYEGYTIPELIHLSRSSNVSQRCISIRTLGNIFLKIRRYKIFNNSSENNYNEYLLGYLFGIQRWYKYLTEDLSIHELFLNMLFHDSCISRTTEHSVIALSNLFCGDLFSSFSLNEDNFLNKNNSLFLYFFTPYEFLFEMMNNKMNYFPLYFRNNIIYQKLDFIDKINEFHFKKTRYEDLKHEDHLIKFQLPDGRKIELLRDILQEIYLFKPSKYDYKVEANRNSLIHFLCNIVENQACSLESRISSLKLVTLFIQRECIDDESIPYDSFKKMLENLGDELFEFVSSNLTIQNYSNYIKLKLLFNYLYFIRIYIQTLYFNFQISENNIIKKQKNDLINVLIKLILQIIRITILSILKKNKLNDNTIDTSAFCFIEGIYIIQILLYKNIIIEDLSIYCKDLIYFMSNFQENNIVHSCFIYHLFMLGQYILICSENFSVVEEHVQFIGILNHFIPKYMKKISFNKKEELNYTNLLNNLLVFISILRFQNLSFKKIKKNFKYELFDYYFQLHEFFQDQLKKLLSEKFDFNVFTLENGVFLEIEMGLTLINDLVNNLKYYKYYSIILLTTYLKEISLFSILLEQNEIKENFIEKIKPNFILIMEFYQKHSNYYNLRKILENRSDFYKKKSLELYEYDICYFEMLYISDDQSLIQNNFIKKNSIFLQILNSNLLYLLLVIYFNINSDQLFNIYNKQPFKLKDSLKSFSSDLSFQIKTQDIDFNQLNKYLTLLLFNNKDIKEYSLVLYSILKINNIQVNNFNEFYNKLLEDYSNYLDISCCLIFNPIIHSINIIYKQFFKREISSFNFLIDVLKRIEQNFSFEKSYESFEITSFFSKYLFEYSVNQLILISRSDNSNCEDFKFEVIGNKIFENLKLSLELIYKVKFEEYNMINNKNISDLLDLIILMRNSSKITESLYDIKNEEDNNYIQKLVDNLISSFCNFEIHFLNGILDCFYLLFVFILLNLDVDSSIQLKLLSNTRILKFILFYKSEKTRLINSLFKISTIKNEIEDIVLLKSIIEIIEENIYLYKDTIDASKLGILLIIYYNNVIKCNNCNILKEFEKVKSFENTEIKILSEILSKLMKNN